MVNSERYDALIIGAGAAGLMCAREAGKRGRKVLVIDHKNKVGSKIRISGGGSCNFSNMDVGADYYLSANKHFCKSALSQFSQYDFISLLQEHKITFHEREHGQLFCNDSAQQIVDMLMTECEKAGVEFKLCAKISRVCKKDEFTITTSAGDFVSANLVVATGGLSFPEIGASNFGYKLAEQFGLSVINIAPALTPLILADKDLNFYQALAGISFEANVRCGKVSFDESVLIMHKGLSGPAMLQISSYWQPGEEIHIHLLPQLDWTMFLQQNRDENPKQELKTILSKVLAKRFVIRFIETGQIKNIPMNQVSDKYIAQITDVLTDLIIRPHSKMGYNKAEVTSGGVNTDELSSKTLESRKVSGLYFIGEVVDVTGWLGGYNLQWAWSSGVAAGRAV